MFDCVQLFTPAVWHNVNPLLEQRIHFTSLQTSPALLEHLQTNALVLELWGLQGEPGTSLGTQPKGKSSRLGM